MNNKKSKPRKTKPINKPTNHKSKPTDKSKKDDLDFCYYVATGNILQEDFYPLDGKQMKEMINDTTYEYWKEYENTRFEGENTEYTELQCDKYHLSIDELLEATKLFKFVEYDIVTKPASIAIRFRLYQAIHNFLSMDTMIKDVINQNIDIFDERIEQKYKEQQMK